MEEKSRKAAAQHHAHKVFKEYDTTGDSSLTKAELHAGLWKLSESEDPEKVIAFGRKINSMFERYDLNHDHKLGFDEFYELYEECIRDGLILKEGERPPKKEVPKAAAAPTKNLWEMSPAEQEAEMLRRMQATKAKAAAAEIKREAEADESEFEKHEQERKAKEERDAKVRAKIAATQEKMEHDKHDKEEAAAKAKAEAEAEAARKEKERKDRADATIKEHRAARRAKEEADSKAAAAKGEAAAKLEAKRQHDQHDHEQKAKEEAEAAEAAEREKKERSARLQDMQAKPKERLHM